MDALEVPTQTILRVPTDRDGLRTLPQLKHQSLSIRGHSYRLHALDCEDLLLKKQGTTLKDRTRSGVLLLLGVSLGSVSGPPTLQVWGLRGSGLWGPLGFCHKIPI